MSRSVFLVILLLSLTMNSDAFLPRVNIRGRLHSGMCHFSCIFLNFLPDCQPAGNCAPNEVLHQQGPCNCCNVCLQIAPGN